MWIFYTILQGFWVSRLALVWFSWGLGQVHLDYLFRYLWSSRFSGIARRIFLIELLCNFQICTTAPVVFLWISHYKCTLYSRVRLCSFCNTENDFFYWSEHRFYTWKDKRV